MGGCAEGPHVAVVAILTPVGFIGMVIGQAFVWASADLGQDPVHYGLGPLRGAMRCSHDGSRAEAQPMDGAQIPLDGPNGQSGLVSERGDQTDPVDTQTLLLVHHHTVQLRWGQTAASAVRAM